MDNKPAPPHYLHYIVGLCGQIAPGYTALLREHCVLSNILYSLNIARSAPAGMFFIGRFLDTCIMKQDGM